MQTADGYEIKDGLRVFTNDLEKGKVVLPPTGNAPYKESTGEWWFDVLLDRGGLKLMSESRVVTRWAGEKA